MARPWCGQGPGPLGHAFPMWVLLGQTLVLGVPKLLLFIYQILQKHTYSLAVMLNFHMGQLGRNMSD